MAWQQLICGSMKRENVFPFLSGCGCWLIPVATIALIMILSHNKSTDTDKKQAIKDSLHMVQVVDSLSSIEYGMDFGTKVIFKETDSLYHYYLNCYKMQHHEGELMIMLRAKAKKMGLKACPDCMDIEQYYMEEKGLPDVSEKHLELLKEAYSDWQALELNNDFAYTRTEWNLD